MIGNTGGSTRDRTKFYTTDHKTNNANVLETFDNYFDTNIYKKSEDDLKLSSKIDNAVIVGGQTSASNRLEDELLRELEGSEERRRYKNTPQESPVKFENTDCLKLISTKGNKKQIDKSLIYLTLDNGNLDEDIFNQEGTFHKLQNDEINPNIFSDNQRSNFPEADSNHHHTSNTSYSKEQNKLLGYNFDEHEVESHVLDYDAEVPSIKDSNFKYEEDLNCAYDIAGAKTDRNLENRVDKMIAKV